MTTPAPASTVALLVGIEQYEAGTSWRLDGPALDAGRFARWLLDCGVPPENITLLVSALPDNQPELSALGLPIRPADSTTVRNVLTRELRETPCDLFVAYWGGHGVVDGRDTRRLFYADASVADKRNLDLTSLMESLSSGFFPAHRRQLIVVDACQNLVAELRLVHSLPGETFPVGPPAGGRELDAILAASPGEIARNIDIRKTGAFSEVTLDILRREGWPPRPEALAQSLRGEFEARWRGGAANQTPAHLWHRGPHGEATVAPAVSARPPQARLPLGAVGRIAGAMLELPEISDALNRQAIIQLLPKAIRAAVPYAPVAQMHVVSLVRTCERFAGGRQALLEALALGVADQEGLIPVLALFDAEWPSTRDPN
jgi:hypothetical protein